MLKKGCNIIDKLREEANAGPEHHKTLSCFLNEAKYEQLPVEATGFDDIWIPSFDWNIRCRVDEEYSMVYLSLDHCYVIDDEKALVLKTIHFLNSSSDAKLYYDDKLYDNALAIYAVIKFQIVSEYYTPWYISKQINKLLLLVQNFAHITDGHYNELEITEPTENYEKYNVYAEKTYFKLCSKNPQNIRVV